MALAETLLAVGQRDEARALIDADLDIAALRDEDLERWLTLRRHWE